MNHNRDALEQAAERLRTARRLAVFTGAGISAESGIPTFRDEDGFWQRFPPEQFANWSGIVRTAMVQPALLAEFLIAVLEPIAVAQPNPAHVAIAQLERSLPTTVITQNVDRLHQDAGSTCVREIHGSFFEIVSLRGRAIRRLERADYQHIVERLRKVQSGWFKHLRFGLAVRRIFGPSLRGIKRPGVVLFGGAMNEPDWSFALNDVTKCDVLLTVGTSGLVYPAASLPQKARQQGAHIITIDPAEPGNAHTWLRGRAGEVLPQLIATTFG